MMVSYLTGIALLVIAGCAPSHAPGVSAAMLPTQREASQGGRGLGEASQGEPGTVAGVRAVALQAGGPVSALAVLRGDVAIPAMEPPDVDAFEYIVRKPAGGLISVTQRDKTPLVLGQEVLVMTGSQARVIPASAAQAAVREAQAGGASVTVPW